MEKSREVDVRRSSASFGSPASLLGAAAPLLATQQAITSRRKVSWAGTSGVEEKLDLLVKGVRMERMRVGRSPTAALLLISVASHGFGYLMEALCFLLEMRRRNRVQGEREDRGIRTSVCGGPRPERQVL